MELSRRKFLALSGAGGAAVALGGLGFDLEPIRAYAQALKIKEAKQIPSICYYCAVGCGVLASVED
ncbi:MAG: twin-arginine translocation signal domain-containing protein, partial [Candidatus Methylomirabilales bacterium]